MVKIEFLSTTLGMLRNSAEGSLCSVGFMLHTLTRVPQEGIYQRTYVVPIASVSIIRLLNPETNLWKYDH